MVLAITAVAWLLWPCVSGYVGGAAWFLFLFLPAIGFRKITELAAQGDYDSALKLGAAVQIVHPTAEVREQLRLFRHLKSSGAHSRASTPFSGANKMGHSTWRGQLQSAPAVFILILLNVLAFLFEMYRGGWDDPMVLHQIGALEPLIVLREHEYWRLFTALFLHAGFLHLGFNLFALYALGAPFERSIGTTRFAACYLLSGLASSTGVVILTKLGLIEVGQVIGASGCIMGIVGAWAGFLLRHHRAPFAKQRLANIGLIVAIQIAFDLSTPQVSMAAHICGLIGGFFLGLILPPRVSTRFAMTKA
jgi:membrane associated rhomboid family serine protease